MADKLWKSVERRIAKYLGGERVPITGRQRGSAPDISHPWLSIEVKQRDSLPAWLADAMDQAEMSVGIVQPHESNVPHDRVSQLPIAILHQTGNRIEDAYVVVRLSDFREWFC